MKKFDYIVIQAPMISELGLKGNSLLLFAMIHGFSKDGKNRFRASLEDMSEWLVTSKAAVSSTLKALEKSGYITKHDVKDGNIDKPEYSTNYETLMAKVEVEGSLRIDRIYAEKSLGVLNQYPSKKRAKSRGTETVPVLNQLQRGTETIPNGGTETVPNKYINIYKYYSCCYSELTEAQKQEEQEQFLKIFFFRGAADPAAEVKRFIAHNQANGWQNKAGAKYDSTEKRLGLAELWDFKTGQRENKTFLELWEKVYQRVADVENSKVLLDPKIKFIYSTDAMTINCTKETKEFLEANNDKVKDIIVAHAAGKRIQYIYLK
jgi:DNA-binding HxlR family transcriptional regulator